MCRDYDLQQCGDGTWSIVSKATQTPITFKGRMQISLTEEAAQKAFAILERIEVEDDQQARDGRQY